MPRHRSQTSRCCSQRAQHSTDAMMQLNFLFWHGIKPPMKYCNLNDPLLTTGSGIRYGIRNDVDNDLTMSSARKRHRTAGYREKKNTIMFSSKNMKSSTGNQNGKIEIQGK
jgi:hypothetical protein